MNSPQRCAEVALRFAKRLHMTIPTVGRTAGKLKSAPACVLLAFFVGSCSGQTRAVASILSNGSFETYAGGSVLFSSGVPGITRFGATPPDATGIAGWTVAGATADNIVLHHAPPGDGLPGIAPLGSHYRFANDGITYLDLSGADSSHATIYQDMATRPGQSYLLSFYLGSSGPYQGPSGPPTNTINVRVDGTLSLWNQTFSAPAPGTNINWQMFSVTFIADSLTTRLSFKDTSVPGTHGQANNDNSYVDSVSVNPVAGGAVPEASAILVWGCLSLIGLGLGVSRVRHAKADA